MLTILLPTDGSEVAMRAVSHVAQLALSGAQVAVHLLNVQPPLPQAVTQFVPAENVRGYHEEEGRKVLAPAEAVLQREDIAFTPRIVIGHAAEQIAQSAIDLGCDQIVMGTRGLSPISNLVLGSTATKVLHLTSVPVTLVK